MARTFVRKPPIPKPVRPVVRGSSPCGGVGGPDTGASGPAARARGVTRVGPAPLTRAKTRLKRVLRSVTALAGPKCGHKVALTPSNKVSDQTT